MQLTFTFLLVAMSMAGEGRRNPALLMRPAILNIGYVCRWDNRCMKRQEQAMNRATKYVRKYRPPSWKIRMCNRNASRGISRVDWIGLENCVRNPRLRPPAARQRR